MFAHVQSQRYRQRPGSSASGVAASNSPGDLGPEPDSIPATSPPTPCLTTLLIDEDPGSSQLSQQAIS